MCAASQLPSAQNNPHVKVACFGAACSDPLLQHHLYLRTVKEVFLKKFQCACGKEMNIIEINNISIFFSFFEEEEYCTLCTQGGVG